MPLPQYLRRELFRTPSAIAMTREYLVNGLIVPHSHDFVEVVLVTAGEGIHRSREEERAVSKGDLLVIRPGAWHTYEACHELLLYNCCFGYELLGREFAWFGEDERLNYLFHVGPLLQGRHGILATRLSGDAVARCAVHLEALCTLEQQPTLPDRITTVATLLLFFGEVAQSIAPSQEHMGHAHPAVLEAARLLVHDLAEGWTMEGLAAAVGLSDAYLSRLFREQMGMPPMSYLHQQRMEEATNLLLHTTHAIGHIAQDVGFSDQNYFARCFKQYYGLAPTAYRRQFAVKKARG